MKWEICILFLLSVAIGQPATSSRNAVPKIGIIGGGIGGTSSAFFLKSLFGFDGVSIDLFEGDKIGGRLSVVNLTDGEYEEGGSVIHSRNRYMATFLNECKLSKRQGSSGQLALYDGKEFVFTESAWAVKTLWRVLYRYGLGLWKLKSHIEDMLNKFDRIYESQEKEEAYETVEELLAAMDPKFNEYLNTSSETGFKNQGIPDLVIHEIIMATTLTNYGQNLGIHEMVGSVSVAGAVGDLWSVRGGNWRIPECLFNLSGANLIPKPVVLVKRLDTGKIQIFTEAEHGDYRPRIYDAVVLAAPQTSDAARQIRFEGFDEDVRFLGRYHKTVCTLVEGRLSDEYFPPRSPSVEEILAVKEGLPFKSIGRVTPVSDEPSGNVGPSKVWKIFTGDPLKEDAIRALFSEVSGKHVREWLAYPHYQSLRFPGKETFILRPNLYHVNAIEWAASAMEMSAIGAKNVALLLYKTMKSTVMESEKVLDEDLGVLPEKTEL